MYITTGVCFTSFWIFSKNQVIQLNYSYYPSCHQCPSCQAQEILIQFSWILFMSGQLHKPTGESKAPCLKTCQLLLLIPLPSYPTFRKSVTPEVPGELSNPRQEEKSLREQGWCTGSHYRLWWCWVQAWLGEPAPQRLLIMGKSSCPGASGRREKRG